MSKADYRYKVFIFFLVIGLLSMGGGCDFEIFDPDDFKCELRKQPFQVYFKPEIKAKYLNSGELVSDYWVAIYTYGTCKYVALDNMRYSMSGVTDSTGVFIPDPIPGFYFNYAESHLRIIFKNYHGFIGTPTLPDDPMHGHDSMQRKEYDFEDHELDYNAGDTLILNHTFYVLD